MKSTLILLVAISLAALLLWFLPSEPKPYTKAFELRGPTVVTPSSTVISGTSTATPTKTPPTRHATAPIKKKTETEIILEIASHNRQRLAEPMTQVLGKWGVPTTQHRHILDLMWMRHIRKRLPDFKFELSDPDEAERMPLAKLTLAEIEEQLVAALGDRQRYGVFLAQTALFEIALFEAELPAVDQRMRENDLRVLRSLMKVYGASSIRDLKNYEQLIRSRSSRNADTLFAMIEKYQDE